MIFIPYLLRSNAILQRDKVTTFWGYTDPQQRVELDYDNRHLETSATSDGYFQFELAPHAASGPITFTLTSGTDQVTSKNVLFGDVWLLSGQSNMQLWMQRLVARYPDEIENAKDTDIHFFMVPQRYDFSHGDSELDSGKWQIAVGKNIEMLSGIGYFYAQLQRRATHVPIGLISTAIGVTPIRSWVSHKTLTAMEELPQNFDKLSDQSFINGYVSENDHYQKYYERVCDRSDQGILKDWTQANVDDSRWDSLPLDGEDWPEMYRQPGTIWIRKHLRMPARLVGKSAEFRLGTFVDADETYLNGQKIGETGYQYPPRNYRISSLPAEITLVVRLHIFSAPGGPRFGKKHLLITDEESVDLDAQGDWLVKRGCWLPPKKESVFPQYQPVGLFNGMIYPLRRLNLKGVLWYQGESDVARPLNYDHVFLRLIQEWRQLFQSAELPFLYVQLPNCAIEPNHVWSKIRLAQKSGLELNHTAMIVALGLGEDNDLHPLNKRGVAQQLFEASQQISKYPNGYCNGPLALGAWVDNQQIRIKFVTFDQKLVISQGYFELIKNGQIIRLSDFKIVGKTIVIVVPEEVKVCSGDRIRYAWGNSPVICLRNGTNQPASPFILEIEKGFYQNDLLANL